MEEPLTVGAVDDDPNLRALPDDLPDDFRDRALRERETALRLADYLTRHHPDVRR